MDKKSLAGSLFYDPPSLPPGGRLRAGDDVIAGYDVIRSAGKVNDYVTGVAAPLGGEPGVGEVSVDEDLVIRYGESRTEQLGQSTSQPL